MLAMSVSFGWGKTTAASRSAKERGRCSKAGHRILERSAREDAIVIGKAAAAYRLNEAGLRVVVLERGGRQPTTKAPYSERISVERAVCRKQTRVGHVGRGVHGHQQ